MTQPVNEWQFSPAAIDYLYFAPVSTDPGLGPIEVSIDDDRTWLTLPLGVDDKGQPAYVWLVAGHHVDPAVVAQRGATQLQRGRNNGTVRIVDSPTVPAQSFRVNVIR